MFQVATELTLASRRSCTRAHPVQDASPILPPYASIEGPGGSHHSRVPFSGVAVFRLGSQKFVPARCLQAYGEGITWRRFPRFCDSRVRLHPLPYIPSCRWIPGAHNGEHARGAARDERKRKRGEEAVKKICGKKGKRAVPRASIMGV